MSESLSPKARLLKLALTCLSWLPRALTWPLCGLLARLMQAAGSRSARVSEENLRLCFPDQSTHQHSALVRASLQHTLYMFFELAGIWTWPWAKVARRIDHRIAGETLFEQAMQDPRGLVLLAPHLGNWEVMGLYLQTRKPVAVLYQPGPSAVVNELMLHARAALGSQVLPTNARGVMGLFKHLKQGGMTGILPDQVPDTKGGLFAPFFGVDAFTMTLIHNLIQRTGCRVLMAGCLRTANGFRLVFEEPPAAIYGDDEMASVTALNQGVENLVRLAPEQYQWEYKRFRRLQPGEQRRYVFK